MEYDAVDPLLNPRGDLVVEALIEGPDGSQSAVELEPSGPGRYRLRLPLEPGGATLVRIAAVGTTSESSAAIPASGELVASLAPGLPEEGRAGRENPALLAAISQQTGGLVDPSTKEVAERPAPTHRVPVPRWPWALGAALVALLLDLSWRRIPWPDARSEA